MTRKLLLLLFLLPLSGCVATYEKGPFRVQTTLTAADFKAIKELSRR